jgi:hypothetical protein
MKPIRAQFARRWMPTRVWWFGCLILIAIDASFAGLAWQSLQRIKATKRELAAIDERVQQARVTGPRPTDASPLPYDSSARDMLAQRSVPWPALLATLEAVSVSGVRLTSVDYGAAESRARVEITFANHAAALKYVQQLSAGVPESGPAWRWRPLLFSQPRVAEKGTATLEAAWHVR